MPFVIRKTTNVDTTLKMYTVQIFCPTSLPPALGKGNKGLGAAYEKFITWLPHLTRVVASREAFYLPRQFRRVVEVLMHNISANTEAEPRYFQPKFTFEVGALASTTIGDRLSSFVCRFASHPTPHPTQYSPLLHPAPPLTFTTVVKLVQYFS